MTRFDEGGNMRRFTILAAIVAGLLTTVDAQQQDPRQDQPSFRFRSAVELINVTATVTDSRGRFVPDLRKEDFRVFEDGQEQTVTHFSNDRVPVSLGIVLDTSSSMEGEKIMAAREALERFLVDLLDRDDEVFLYRFDSVPRLLSDWTTDRGRLRSILGRIRPQGGTALYDTVADAVPLAQTGQHRKKAVLVISDGNDTSSETSPRELKQLIRESEVLVYAIGIDGESRSPYSGSPGIVLPPRQPFPFPFPMPGRRTPTTRTPPRGARTASERVDVVALRDLTDDSGGRTEIVRTERDLDPATANIADELSKQYYLGYPSPGKKDGLWHSIRVELRNPDYRIRARRGYIATP